MLSTIIMFSSQLAAVGLLVMIVIYTTPTCFAMAGAGESTCMCSSPALIKDCCCSFNDVSTLNREYIRGVLKKLIDTQFFRRIADPLRCHRR